MCDYFLAAFFDFFAAFFAVFLVDFAAVAALEVVFFLPVDLPKAAAQPSEYFWFEPVRTMVTIPILFQTNLWSTGC